MSQLVCKINKIDCIDYSQSFHDQKKWFVFYTRPRTEKKVHYELINSDYDVFLPTVKTLRLWKNRQKKWVESALFPGYIFINTVRSSLSSITLNPNVVTYIRCGGEPSTVRDRDIQGIRHILGLNQDISVESTFREGEIVRIIKGPLTGYEGIIEKQKSKTRFGIQLKEINQTVFIDICTSMVERISVF